MGMRKQAKRIAAGASVALATSGLSNCRDGGGGGVVDPPPPPLQCNLLDMGQSLAATATRAADTVRVNFRSTLGYETWQVNRVAAGSGATLLSTRLPSSHTREHLEVTLRLNSDTTTTASFTIAATLYGPGNDTCTLERTFELTISSGGVQVSLAGTEPLPLAARQRAAIVLAGRAGRVVELVADTQWPGARDLSWTVNDGTLDVSTGPTVRWTLPAAAGIYQAELVVDFGAAGLAIDTLLLEVV